MCNRPHSAVAALLLALFAWAALSTARAGEAKPEDDAIKAFNVGKAYFDKGEFDKAYEYLFKAFQEHPQDANINFYLGRTAFERGDYESAVMAYDRILTLNPNQPRVKLELGRAYFKLGSIDLARKEFEEVLAAKPPEQVRKNIESFMRMMDRSQRRHFFNGLLTLGITYDDNIRVYAENSTIIVPSTGLVELREPRDAIMHSATLVLSHKYKFPDKPFVWKTVLVNYDTSYNEGERDDPEDGLDVNYYTIRTGPGLEFDHFTWDLQGRFTYMDQDFKNYLKSWAVSSDMNLLFNSHVLLNGSFKLECKKLYTNRNRDANNMSFNIGPVLLLGKNRVMLKATIEDENANLDEESYKSWGAQIRYDRELPKKFGAYASYRYTNSDYEGFDTLFERGRKDNVHELSVGLTKQFTDRISAELSHTYTKSFSNIGLYRYNRSLTAFSVSWSF